jgi:hypothetical protein
MIKHIVIISYYTTAVSNNVNIIIDNFEDPGIMGYDGLRCSNLKSYSAMLTFIIDRLGSLIGIYSYSSL